MQQHDRRVSNGTIREAKARTNKILFMSFDRIGVCRLEALRYLQRFECNRLLAGLYRTNQAERKS